MEAFADFEFVACNFGTNREYLFHRNDHMAYTKCGQGKTAEGNDIQYYACIEKNCPARGRFVQGIFSRTCRRGKTIPAHSHQKNHKKLIAKMKAIHRIKSDALKAGSKPLRKVFLDRIKR